jgi:hypothetical protein
MSNESENRIFEKLEELCEKIDRLDQQVTGGDEPGRGLIIRLDRLEQARASTDKWIAIIAAAAATGFVSGIGAIVWKVFKG